MKLAWIAALALACAGDDARRVPSPPSVAPPNGAAQPAAAEQSTTAAGYPPAAAQPAAAAQAIAAQPATVEQPAAAAAPPAVERAAAAQLAVNDARDATRKAAHAVLVEHCGECHEGHRSTAKPAALAVFDLDLPDWPTRFDAHRSQTALGRLASKPAARVVFVAFLDAERTPR